MKSEIEIKLKVDSHSDVISQLELSPDANFLGESIQIDYLFDDASASLTETDRCIRLRKQVSGKTTRFFLTYKGIRQKSIFKKRYEIETEVLDGNVVQEFLLLLGYNTTLIIKKKRMSWELDDCEIALDHLRALGTFVEIEGPNEEKISAVQEKLGLTNCVQTTESYAALIREQYKLREALNE